MSDDKNKSNQGNKSVGVVKSDRGRAILTNDHQPFSVSRAIFSIGLISNSGSGAHR